MSYALVAAFCLSLTASLSASAPPADGGRAAAPPPPPAILAHELGLTAEQEAQMREILDGHHARRQEADSDRRRSRDQLFASLREVLSEEQFDAFLDMHERHHRGPPPPPRRR